MLFNKEVRKVLTELMYKHLEWFCEVCLCGHGVLVSCVVLNERATAAATPSLCVNG